MLPIWLIDAWYLPGEWAQRVQHPSNNLTKEYVVTLAQTPTAHQLEDIAAGCVIDGAFVKPRSISYATADRRDKLRIVIGEGRNREVSGSSRCLVQLLTGSMHCRPMNVWCSAE